MTDEPHLSIHDLFGNLVSVLLILLKDQGTVQKKWQNVLQSEETVEVGGVERLLKLKSSMEYFEKIGDIQTKLLQL